MTETDPVRARLETVRRPGDGPGVRGARSRQRADDPALGRRARRSQSGVSRRGGRRDAPASAASSRRRRCCRPGRCRARRSRASPSAAARRATCRSDNPIRALDEAGYVGTLATNSELEFVRYLRPGDQLHAIERGGVDLGAEDHGARAGLLRHLGDDLPDDRRARSSVDSSSASSSSTRARSTSRSGTQPMTANAPNAEPDHGRRRAAAVRTGRHLDGDRGRRDRVARLHARAPRRRRSRRRRAPPTCS